MAHHKIFSGLQKLLSVSFVALLFATSPAGAETLSPRGTQNKNSPAYRLWLRQQTIKELEQKFAQAINLANQGKCLEARNSFTSGFEMLEKDNTLPTTSLASAANAVSNCVQAERNIEGVTQTADLASMAIAAAQMGQCGAAQQYLTQARILMTAQDGSPLTEKTMPVLEAIKTVNGYCHQSSKNAK